MGLGGDLWRMAVRGRRGRRSYERCFVTAAGELRVGSSASPCLIRDISASGAFIVLPDAPPPGALGEFVLPTAALRTSVRVVRRTGEGCGIRFQSDEIGAVLAGWVRAVGDAPLHVHASLHELGHQSEGARPQ